MAAILVCNPQPLEQIFVPLVLRGYYNWPMGFGEVIWKCWRWMTMKPVYPISSFSSGELKNQNTLLFYSQSFIMHNKLNLKQSMFSSTHTSWLHINNKQRRTISTTDLFLTKYWKNVWCVNISYEVYLYIKSKEGWQTKQTLIICTYSIKFWLVWVQGD